MSPENMVFDPHVQPIKGAHSIEASAGTGKTFSITLLWLRLILEENLAVEQILVSTFTKAATAELKDRLLETLKDARLGIDSMLHATETKETDAFNVLKKSMSHHPERSLEDWKQCLDLAISCFDLAPIVTIHGFCDRLLRQHALELGCDPDLELITDISPMVQRVTEDFLMRRSEITELSLENALKVAKVIANESAIDRDHIQSLAPYVHEDYEKLCLRIKSDQEKYDAKWPSTAKKMVAKFLQNNDFSDFSTWPPKGPPAYFSKMDEVDPHTLECLYQAKGMLESKVMGWSELIDDIKTHLPQVKTEASVRSYDDVLLSIRSALRNPHQEKSLSTSVQQRYQAVIIDECQDSDAVQIEIFQKLFLTTNSETLSFIVIGDPKQSIYRFRGADLSSYSQLAQSCLKAPEMMVNYRSDERLVKSLNAIYQKNASFTATNSQSEIRYIQVGAKNTKVRITDIPKYDDDSCFWILSQSTDKNNASGEIASKVALECQRSLAGDVRIEDRFTRDMRPLRASDIAILAATSQELSLTQQYLTALGIPCQLTGKGAGSVYQSDEALDLLVWLELLTAVHHGGDVSRRLLAFAATPLSGKLYGRLASLAKETQLISEVIRSLQKQAEEFAKQGPLPTLIRHLHEPGMANVILGHIGGERTLTNWKQLASDLQKDWSAGQRKLSMLTQTFARRQADTQADEEQLLRLETDLPAVQLVTIHSSKGLEYPIVFCPFLWRVKSLQFRKQSKMAAIARSAQGSLLDIMSPDHDRVLTTDLQQENEEAQRLLYVALTRARHRLVLGFAPVEDSGPQHRNGALQSALAKLLMLEDSEPESLLEALPPWPRLEPMPINGHCSTQATNDLPLSSAPPELNSFHRGGSRLVSFSGLIKNENQLQSHKDRDEESSSEKEDVERQYGLLEAKLGSGTTLGNQVHDILEQVLGNGKSLKQAIHSKAKNNPGLLEPMERMLQGPIPLRHRTLSLQEFAQRSITEMHFIFPLEKLSPRHLSEVLVQLDVIKHHPLRLTWAQSVMDWSFERIKGYLQGYIDLTVNVDDKWYIADYKTNLLTGYNKTDCEEAMIHGHYFLQGLIYACALHRHLKSNVDHYEVEQHFGGMVYLFVRGLENGDGVWFDTPSASDLEQIDDLFNGTSVP